MFVIVVASRRLYEHHVDRSHLDIQTCLPLGQFPDMIPPNASACVANLSGDPAVLPNTGSHLNSCSPINSACDATHSGDPAMLPNTGSHPNSCSEIESACATETNVGAKEVIAFYSNVAHPSVVGCFWCGATKSAKSWGALLQHAKNVHGKKIGDFAGSKLYTLGQEELTQQQKEKRHAHPKPKGFFSKMKTEPSTAEEDVEAEKQVDDASLRPLQTITRPILCWVRCSPDGTPLNPLQVDGICPNTMLNPASTLHSDCSSGPTQIDRIEEQKQPVEQVSQPILDEGRACRPAQQQDMVVTGVAAPTPELIQQDLLADIVSKGVRQALQLQRCAAPVPKIHILDIWRTWVPPETWLADAHDGRRRCPLSELCSHNLEEFQEWLPANVTNDAVTTAPVTVRNMRRLLGMLRVDVNVEDGTSIENDMWYVGTAVGIHKQQLVNSLFGLEVLRADYGWSRAMLTALKHFVKFAKARAIAQELRAERDDLIDMESSFGHLTAAHSGSRKTSSIARAEIDGVRIENQPSRQDVKLALRHTMRDLIYLRDATSGQLDLTSGQRAAANMLTLAMVYLNGKAGRSGEWMKATFKATRQRLFADRCDYLIAHDHKRAKQRGSLVKVLAPATKKMVKIHMSLPGQKKKQFLFDSARTGSKGSTIARYIHKWDMVYFGRVCHGGSNLLRKKLASARFEAAQRRARMAGACEDGHSLSVEDSNYVTLTPARKAALAREALASEVDTVDWLTQQEITEMGTVYWAGKRKDDGGISVAVAGGAFGHASAMPSPQEQQATELPRRACKDKSKHERRVKQKRGDDNSRPSQAVDVPAARPHAVPEAENQKTQRNEQNRDGDNSAPSQPLDVPAAKPQAVPEPHNQDTQRNAMQPIASVASKGKPSRFTEAQQGWLQRQFVLYGNCVSRKMISELWIPKAQEDCILEIPELKHDMDLLIDQMRQHCRTLAKKL